MPQHSKGCEHGPWEIASSCYIGQVQLEHADNIIRLSETHLSSAVFPCPTLNRTGHFAPRSCAARWSQVLDSERGRHDQDKSDEGVGEFTTCVRKPLQNVDLQEVVLVP